MIIATEKARLARIADNLVIRVRDLVDGEIFGSATKPGLTDAQIKERTIFLRKRVTSGIRKIK